ncbi:hypothetical protein RND61_24875 [Streptomyces sp. TRM76323]|uniref:Uncharacterized protein n=1 Tax=Streptomyces tamarix TaxID=3078565 RepID=A0ABU3QRN4_9ACTN|nr:hypothetical protein [Streptomyces tamarix]MDT9685271.1 hypothetical protein [Streptomyces tamarix]
MTGPPARTAEETGGITVHRCTVTVVRRGGWSWGPDPRALVQNVIDTLPELLADHFAQQLAGDGPDVEITEPVTVTVRPGGPGWPGRTRAPTEVRFAPVPLAEALGEEPPGAVSFEESFAATAGPRAEPVAAALFGELAERGELDALIALLPEESLRAYALALLGADDAAAAHLLAELVRRARTGGPVEPQPGHLAAYLGSAGREEAARLVRSLTGPHDRAAGEPAPRAGGTVAARAGGEVRVRSALPFLLAGPLARIGYLDAIGPALAGVELAEEAPLFAAALAYKVLGATARGWRRGEQDSEAAAAFAGLEPPVPEERLTAFARAVRPALPVLDGVLALSVCRGHDPADPLLLTGTGDGLLLVDAQGVFPIAWAADTAALLPYWRECGRPPVLVCDGPLPPGSLRELASADVPFLTGVRPLRGDPVARLPWRTPLWTGTTRRRPDPRLAAELPGHADRLAGLVTALVTERRAVPLARDAALERTVTLAAALGLSTIAWTLWRDREIPDPLPALNRFADLEATVRFEPAAVRVRVPMGRRHADLLRGGLLADVPDVVWLGGRTLTFSGG